MFWLLMQSDASRKKRNWISNLNACCACAGSSRGSTPKVETGRQKRGWSFWDISTQNSQTYRQQHQHLEICLFICYFKHAPCTNIVSMLVMCQTSASEEHQELTIKAPPEVGYLFSDSEGKPAQLLRLLKSFYGLTSAPRAWLDITQKFSQLGWKPMSTDQSLWCRYSDDGELKGSSESMLTISCLVWPTVT